MNYLNLKIYFIQIENQDKTKSKLLLQKTYSYIIFYSITLSKNHDLTTLTVSFHSTHFFIFITTKLVHNVV